MNQSQPVEELDNTQQPGTVAQVHVAGLLRAVVTGDHAGFLRHRSALLVLVGSQPRLLLQVVHLVSEANRSCWVMAIAQGSFAQRALCRSLTSLQEELLGDLVNASSSRPRQHAASGGRSGLPARDDASADLVRTARRALPRVSERESQVLASVADGLTNKQIAQRLGLSPNTIKRHMTRVMQRLKLPTRSAVAVWFASNQPAASVANMGEAVGLSNGAESMVGVKPLATATETSMP